MEPITVICIVMVAAFGLIAGSFFNVLIWRLPREESVILPASHCPACNRAIRPFENIPIVSYILLGGKCAGCKARISPVYPVVELVTALCALLLWFTLWTSYPDGAVRFSASWWFHTVHLLLESCVLLLLIPITVIDLRHFIIPDELTIPFALIALAAAFMPGDILWYSSLLGVLAGAGTLLAIGWLGKIIFRKGEAMGGGDIKLLAVFGALWGPKVALLSIFFGSLLGTFGAVYFVFLGKLRSDHHIPFGPFLALGVWIAVLAGDRLINGYMQFMMGLMGR